MKRNTLRLICQIGSTLGLSLLFFSQDFLHILTPLFYWMGWLDPLAGLAGFIQGKGQVFIFLSLMMLSLAIWRGRLFCGWICPVGTVLDLLDRLQRKLRWKNHFPQAEFDQWLTLLRWIILGGVIGFILLKVSIVLAFNPFVLWSRELTRLGNRMIPWSLLGLIAMGLLTFPRFWCRYLCPTGSLLSLVSRWRKPWRVDERCKHCGVCVKICPMQNIDQTPLFGSDCLHCGECRRICPTQCLTTHSNQPKPVDESRRSFLLASAAGLGVLILGKTSTGLAQAFAKGSLGSRLLRPPGTLIESALALACDRCGQCLQVCPTKVLVPAGWEAGWQGLGTPRVMARRGRCMMCMACGTVCPTQSIVKVDPATACIGKAQIDHPRCRVWGQGIDCLLCVEVCPTFAVTADEKERPVIDSKKCIGCGACEAGCPVEGSAIIVTNEGEKRRSEGKY